MNIQLFKVDILGRKEGNVLFNDALNAFYLWLYGVGHIVKDHSDSERENPLLPLHGYSFQLAARVLLYAPSHRQAFDTSVVEHWMEQYLSGSMMKDRCMTHHIGYTEFLQQKKLKW